MHYPKILILALGMLTSTASFSQDFDLSGKVSGSSKTCSLLMELDGDDLLGMYISPDDNLYDMYQLDGVLASTKDSITFYSVVDDASGVCDYMDICSESDIDHTVKIKFNSSNVPISYELIKNKKVEVTCSNLK